MAVNMLSAVVSAGTMQLSIRIPLPWDQVAIIPQAEEEEEEEAAEVVDLRCSESILESIENDIKTNCFSLIVRKCKS